MQSNEQNNEPKNTEATSHADVTPVTPEAEEANHEAEALKAMEIAQKEILYIRAEFENYRKRIQKEQETAIRFANKNLIADLLNLSDFFDRAVEHGGTLKQKNDADVNNFINGVEMTRNELLQLMQRSGVEFVGTAGEKFDPEKHEAISQITVADKEADTVIQVVQKGCKLHGKLIKPARVVVSQK